MWVFLNGKILSKSEANIDLTDLGVVRGYGVFDYFRTYSGKLFRVENNLDRLKHSAQQLGIPVPYSETEIIQAIQTLLGKHNFPEADVRIVLTGGVSEDAVTLNKPTFYILIRKLIPLPKMYYTQGVKVISYNYMRSFPSAKSIDYCIALAQWPHMLKAGAAEVLYAYENKVYEGAMSNFFLFKKDTLVTPKNDILKGITRKYILELARKDFQVEERDITVAELKSATEAFVTAANKRVLPVVQIDEHKVGQGVVGKNTKRLMALFDGFTNSA